MCGTRVAQSVPKIARSLYHIRAAQRAKNIRRNGEESGACLGVPSIAPGQSVTVAPPEQRCATRMFEFQMV